MWSAPQPCRTCGRASERGSRYCKDHLQNAATDLAAQRARTDANREAPWRKWYSRAQWRNLRTLVLAKNPICCDCGRAASTEADHIKPHRGDWSLFCDLNNLQGLCKSCHDKKTAS